MEAEMSQASGTLLIANEFQDRYHRSGSTHGARRMNPSPDKASSNATPAAGEQLGRCARGWSGWVTGLAPTDALTIPWVEMERRLLEMGFVEGARVEILHEGPFGRDPLAVRVDDLTVALRRREADVVLVAEG